MKATVTAWLFAASGAATADPVAFLSDLRGEVLLDGAGRPPFFAELLPGSRLTLGAGASAAVMYVVSGDEYALKGPGDYSVARDGVKASRGAAPDRRAATARPSLDVLVRTSRAATASLRMRSAPGTRPDPAPGPLYPVAASIATLQPTLRWNGDANALHAIEVTSPGGKSHFQGNVRGTSFTLPIPLSPGVTYAWRCSRAGTTLGEARFETLAAEAIRSADRARARARNFSGKVALALSLQELGAAQDAREVWSHLAAERPDIPELAGLAR